MAVGDVHAEIIATTTTAAINAINGARVNANDKYFFIPIANGQQIMFIRIEEAP